MDSKVLRVFCTALLVVGMAVMAGCNGETKCPEGQVMCSNNCVNWLTDEDHCGQCDNACGNYADCVNGQCSCVLGYSDCSGNCVNLNFDAANCGTCGNACTGTDPCVAGVCRPDVDSCESIGMTTCGTVCVDIQSDEDNCGACNNACRADQVCNNGTCACFGGESECAGACVNTLTDRNNCGTCGTVCPTGENCISGTCRGGTATCEDLGLVTCNDGTNDICVDTNTDNAYCGDCNTSCDVPGGFTCQNGSCDCFAGDECVAGTCTDTNSDHDHCGACNNACRADQYCNGGTCDCPAGEQECVAGTCTNTLDDENNCGTCGTICDAGAFCVDGLCQGECNAPNIVCGTDCINPNTDNSNCGTCGTVCTVADGFICQAATCDCIPGLTNCSGVCVNTQADITNCGTCGTTCGGGQYCNSGTCVCAGGLDFCGGNCVDTDTDESNCGACGVICGGDETCMGGTCVPSSIERIVLTCPESAMPENASMQCTAMAHYVGGSPAPIDITDEDPPITVWAATECTAGCIAGDIIDSVDKGLVTTLNNLGIGQLGDKATITATYSGLTSNPWTITLVKDYLCDVKIVPEEYDIETWGKDDDFALPYLSVNAPGGGLTWDLIPVGVYRNNAQCTVGGPYYREITEGDDDWSIVNTGHLNVTAQGGLGNEKATARVIYKDPPPDFPDDLETVTVIYHRDAWPNGDMEISDTILIDVVPLNDANWSLMADPTSLSIPDGKADGFTVSMIFDGNTLNVSNLSNSHNWVNPVVEDTADPDDLVSIQWDPPIIELDDMWGVLANLDVGSGTTIVRASLANVVPAPDTTTMSADVSVEVIAAVPVSCEIRRKDDESTDRQIYPTLHEDVQYEVFACMSDNAGCDEFTEGRDITAEDWGDGWKMDYAGASGALGYVDAYGTGTAGLYHIPGTAPMNPNPEGGMIVYQYGPDPEDSCSVDVAVRERHLCSIDVSSEPDLLPGQQQTTRRLWYPNGPMDDSVLLPNVSGLTQQFFVYGEYGYVQGMVCAANGSNINGYREAIALGDIDEWEYIEDTAHDDHVFGANGVNPSTGIGTVAESTDELDRQARITVHVRNILHACPNPVTGCVDTIDVNVCGVPLATPSRQCASDFQESNPGPDLGDGGETTYAGDVTTRYYAIQRYDAPAGGCWMVPNVAPLGGDYWMDESLEANTRFASQATTIATVDNTGLVNARTAGDTFIDCNWGGGTAEDNIQIHVKGPLVESFTFTPIGTETNPVVVTYAPGSAGDFDPIALQAQFFATATLTNGDVVDLADWIDTFPAGYELGSGTGVYLPALVWSWAPGCTVFDDPTNVPGDPIGGIVTPWGDFGDDSGEDACTLTAVCVDCGPGHDVLDPGISTFDPDPDSDDIITSEVEAEAATPDAGKFFIQTPLATCYDPPAATFIGYAISATIDSEMDLYACIGYDNGIYRALERLSGDDHDVTWTPTGTIAVDDDGRIYMDGGTGEIWADFGGCSGCRDNIVIQAGGTNYLTAVAVGTRNGMNFGNCTAEDGCMLDDQTIQFTCTGTFGTANMDLTTMAQFSLGAFAGGLFNGFATAPSVAVDTTQDIDVRADVSAENDTITMRVYGEYPTSLNVTVNPTSLDFSDYLAGSGGVAVVSATTTVDTNVTIDVTNDLVVSISDVTYLRMGEGGVPPFQTRGTDYFGNLVLLPNDGTATGLDFIGEYWYWETGVGWETVTDTVSNIRVNP